jgi:hypothetical protein
MVRTFDGNQLQATQDKASEQAEELLEQIVPLFHFGSSLDPHHSEPPLAQPAVCGPFPGIIWRLVGLVDPSKA